MIRRCCECGERIIGDERVEFGEWHGSTVEVVHVTHRGACADRFERALFRRMVEAGAL